MSAQTGGVPWKLKAEHRHRHAARMLRTQDRLEAGMVVGPTLVGQVTAWRESLEADNSVVDYDPDTEEGFWRVPRRPGVDKGWVRDPSV